MKQLFYLVCLFISSFSFAQSSSSNELVAGGTATMKVMPDIAILRITVEKENAVEKKAIKELNDEVDKLITLFTKLGFSQNNIRISGYVIEKSDYSEDKKYKASNSLTVEFTLDNKLLDAFYGELQTGDYNNVDVDFETKLSGELEKASKQKLVQLAIKDAKENAENIATTLGVKLKGIKSVTKFTISGPYERSRSGKAYAAAAMMSPPRATSFSKYEVEEKELEEEINIVYEIGK
jgi:uncharacterized protein YggE